MKSVLNDLYDYKNMKIYQLEGAFKFSVDSILLAEYVTVTSSKQIIVDLCTGNAVVPLILSTKYDNKIIGIELQKVIAKLALDSVLKNKKEQITIVNDDINNILNHIRPESVDIVTCNPPYFKKNNKSLINENSIKAIARHEIAVTLEEIVKAASKILKNNKYFYLVHRTDRLEEIIVLLNKYNFYIKNMQFVYSKTNNNATLVLIKASKNGNDGMTVSFPVITENLNTFQNIFEGEEL